MPEAEPCSTSPTSCKQRRPRPPSCSARARTARCALVVNFDRSVEQVAAVDVVRGDRADRRRRRRRPADDGRGGRQERRAPCARHSWPAASALAAALAVKVLALDYGSARTGVAVSDPTGTVARPVGNGRTGGDGAGFERLVEAIGAEEPELVVVGMPLTLRGEHGEQARETAAFVERLRDRRRRPGRDLRRALHLRPRRRRRRAGRRAPAVELPRVAERGPLSDDRPSRGQIRRGARSRSSASWRWRS